MATTRRNLRSLPRRTNPVRDLISEKQRAVEVARSRERAQRLQEDLPSIINEQVGEHMQKLETRLVENFRQMGQRVVEESATALNDQLGDRIETLEQISSIQTRTLTGLRDSSRAANAKVGNVVDEIERALAGAVPGFKLDPPAHPPLPEPQQAYAPAGQIQPAAHIQIEGSPIRDHFRLEARTSLTKADTQEVDETRGRLGFCPNCTSTNVRRSKRSGLFEEFLRLFFIAPFRCRACRHKFYRF